MFWARFGFEPPPLEPNHVCLRMKDLRAGPKSLAI
jgi:hypothetical protein